jgi:hypothetical protein
MGNTEFLEDSLHILKCTDCSLAIVTMHFHAEGGAVSSSENV